MNKRDESQPTISNQGLVQGQNIAHHQHITQHFHEHTSGEPILPFQPERIWLVPYGLSVYF